MVAASAAEEMTITSLCNARYAGQAVNRARSLLHIDIEQYQVDRRIAIEDNLFGFLQRRGCSTALKARFVLRIGDSAPRPLRRHR